jgi:hypothetical protein
MFETLQQKVAPVDSRMRDEAQEKEETLDPRVLSSVLISLKLSQTQDENMPAVDDPHARLLELMHSAPVKSLLDTAAVYARREGIAPHAALRQVVSNMQEIDRLWNLVLMKEGLSRLSNQYH